MRAQDQSQQSQGGEGRFVLIVAGPTASGKSALALDVAEHFTGTVINADSMQVYREMRVLTARPSPDDEKRVPHRLFGVLGAGETCSAGRWAEMAAAEIEAAFAQGRLPVVVGGTGMYLQALTEGLSPIPDIPPQVREEARQRYEALGAPGFHAELARLDPATARRLPPGDTQRLLRAWEVTTFTKRAFSDWRTEPRVKALDGVRFATIVLAPPRAALYAAIDARFARMVEQGALEEVRALLALGLDASLPAMKALGVAELAAHVRGETTLETAVAQAQQTSRHYAKRQLTWVRHQMPGAYVLSAQYSESLRQKIFSFVHQFLLTGAG